MIGSTLYLVGKEYKTNKYVEGATPCELCKRFIINAGIENIIIRDTKDKYRTIKVSKYIQHDDTIKETI